MGQFFLGLILAISLNTPIVCGTHPNGELYTSIQCEQCGDWYIPMSIDEIVCPCEWID